MKTKNKVVFIIAQTIPASITGKGKLQEDLHLYHSFETETTSEINSHNLGLWLQANMIKFVKLQKLQGNETFRQNKPVDVTIRVNSKEEKVSMKFSLNIDRIVANLEKYPTVIGQLFVPVTGMGSITAKHVLAIANGDKVVIANKVDAKKDKVIDITPVNEAGVSFVDNTKFTLEGVEFTDED
jgi:hypothetical protein